MVERSGTEPSAREVLVANERAKARASYLNSLAVAVLAVGGTRADMGVEGFGPMTLQAVSFFIMPVGALLIGLIVVYQPHREAQLNRRK